MLRFAFTILAISVLFDGCYLQPAKPVRTQLEIREFQTRIFNDRDVKSTMQAVIQALLDEGFIVRNADKDLGFINAQKQEDLTNPSEQIWSTVLMGAQATWKVNAVLECSATIQQFTHDVRVRLVVQRQVINNIGTALSTETVDDPFFYQNLFSKIDKSLYLEREKL